MESDVHSPNLWINVFFLHGRRKEGILKTFERKIDVCLYFIAIKNLDYVYIFIKYYINNLRH